MTCLGSWEQRMVGLELTVAVALADHLDPSRRGPLWKWGAECTTWCHAFFVFETPQPHVGSGFQIPLRLCSNRYRQPKPRRKWNQDTCVRSNDPIVQVGDIGSLDA